MKMNEQILSIMETNGRISLEELAERVGEPQEKVAAAIDEMEKDNVICGYHTLINWDKTEEEKVIALIEVKVTPQREMGFDTIAHLDRLTERNE